MYTSTRLMMYTFCTTKLAPFLVYKMYTLIYCTHFVYMYILSVGYQLILCIFNVYIKYTLYIHSGDQREKFSRERIVAKVFLVKLSKVRKDCYLGTVSCNVISIKFAVI